LKRDASPLADSSSADAVTDVLIVGGGVCGTALLFTLARYTDLAHITLVERYDQLAQVNSKATSNSQTIHCGDIETNYTLEKALRVQRTAEMIGRYGDLLDPGRRDRCVFRTPKMVLAVGPRECELLRERFQRFAPHFPAMELLEKPQIAEWEPEVALVNGDLRPEELLAIGIRLSPTAVDYEALSESFVEQANEAVAGLKRVVDVRLCTRVIQIEAEGDFYRVELAAGAAESPRTRLRARHVVVNAGAHSLLLAQKMGYGLEYSCLPVAGSFYFTPDLLRGKVWAVLAVLWQLFGDADIRSYILRNLLFEVPWLRRRLFLADARKIVPALQLDDLRFAAGYGGVRPQLIDRQNRRLMLGEVCIPARPGLSFNVTPSPGGTCCLGNAERDALAIRDHLGCHFDHARLVRELVGEEARCIEAPSAA